MPRRTRIAESRARERIAGAVVHQRILATVDSIPRGKVASYGQIAAAAGVPGRARLVGRLLAGLGGRSALPWHRVLGAGGRIAVGGAARREQLARLRREGVTLTSSGRVAFAAHVWRSD